ncbi:MAG: ABC transporter ATP-binding protein [Desulfobacterales bacterium]|nr:ABC transporter ATP-binding protein [Desulfobacterales bacterium]MCP4162255.1 ABC transporter ATP-binding protein [Deltaproteobacteria bacterium]
MIQPLLEIQGLKTHFFSDKGVAKAVDNVSFKIYEGETLSVVGESGCGKSVTALSVMGLIPNPPGKIVDGSINFQGRNLLDLSEREMRKIRGCEISMIFQEPMTSLNPSYTVGNQIYEVLKLHQSLNKNDAKAKTIDLLDRVKIPSPEKRINDYPHQMSGGMRQRVMIAMALACDPKLIIADEPTTALDVTIQAQILDLMEELSDTTGTSILMITHDLGVVAECSKNVVVMYAGRVVENGDVHQIFNNPLHPYTRGLMKSIPGIGKTREIGLDVIPGTVPSLFSLPAGCKFCTRCKDVMDRCMIEEPRLKHIENGQHVRCWLHEEA